MKSKILIYTLILSLLMSVSAGLSVYAEEGNSVIKIEAEDFETGDDIFSHSKEELASGGQYLSSWHAPTGKENLTYTYTFNAPEKGNYKLDGRINELGKSYTTDITVYVNTPENGPSSWSTGARIGERYFYETTGGTVKVNKGKNTLYMVINGTDLNDSGAIAVYLDCFTLTRGGAASFKLESVTLDKPFGVFEEGQNININFLYSAPTPAIQEYEMSITDLWDREVKKGDITIKKGVEETAIALGKFPIGWYRVRIADKKSKVEVNDYMAFSIVVPYSKRPQIDDSTIAADSDIAWNSRIYVFPNYEEEFNEVAKLAGLKWLRTRTSGKHSSDTVKKIGNIMKEMGINQDALTSPDIMGDKTMKGDLFTYGYQLWKDHAEWYEDTLGVLESVNEADLANKNNKGAAERYSAYYKASAIGMADAKNHPYQTMTPTAGDASIWIDTMYANDIARYTDIINYHTHDNVTKRTNITKGRAVAYTDEHLPMWTTEAGYQQTAKDGNNLSLDQMKDASEQLIKRAFESLTNGATKHFWFLLTPYIENNGNFSSHHPSGMPYAMYSVLSNLTYQLGEAEFIGVADLPDGMTGYMFNDGVGNDVMVCYADTENYATVIKADKITYSDMVGYEEVKYADANGEIKIFAGTEPVFVKFFGKAPVELYYPKTFEYELKHREFAPNERIVIQQIWDDELFPVASAHSNGYILTQGEEYEVPLKLYNFNDEPMSGTLTNSAADQIISETEPIEFTIEPWKTFETVYKFKVREDAVGGTDGNIMFSGTTESGDELSPSVAYFKITSEGRVIDEDKRVAFADAYKKERWNLGNIAEGGKVTMNSIDEEQAASFNVSFTGNTWFFPYFKITDEEREALKSAQGFIFDAKAAGHDGSPALAMFVYMKDGRQYYSSSIKMPFEKMEEGYVTGIFPFSMFTLYSSPLGGVEIRPFDIESIENISIGFSITDYVVPEYRFKNFGYFYSDIPSEQLTNIADIDILGIEEGKVYQKGELSKITANFNADDKIASYKVTLNNDKLENVTFDGKKFEFDLSGLERGAYTVYVTALNEQNAYFCGTKNFKVE